jgi:hypothetical protein
MKSRPTTSGEWFVYVLAIALLQPSTMYLCLRVFHWNFLLSAFLAGGFAVGAAMLAVTALNTRSVK